MIKLFKHQRETLEHHVKNRGVSLDLSDPGTGKTISTLAYLAKYKDKVGHIRALVIAPKSVMLDAWQKDLKHFDNLSSVIVTGTATQKKAAFAEVVDVYITNYETLLKYDLCYSGITHLVCDEGVKLKNHSAKWTKAITKLSKHTKCRIIISGLLTPNNLMEIYSPINILDPQLLGISFWAFRAMYFNETRYDIRKQGKNIVIRNYMPKNGALESITKKIAHLVIRHEKSKVLDLPAKLWSTRTVDMLPEQKRIYNEMKKDAVAKVRDITVSSINKVAALMKLSQISSGFIYDEAKIPTYFKSGKLNELKEMIGNGKNSFFGANKAIIFYRFKAEVELFKKMFPNEAFLTGGLSSDAFKNEIERFKSGKSQHIFASINATKYGITLTEANYVVYYSFDYNYDTFVQSQDRPHRIGQERNVNYIVLQTENSIDSHIYSALMEKKTINEIIFSAFK